MGLTRSYHLNIGSTMEITPRSECVSIMTYYPIPTRTAMHLGYTRWCITLASSNMHSRRKLDKGPEMLLRRNETNSCCLLCRKRLGYKQLRCFHDQRSRFMIRRRFFHVFGKQAIGRVLCEALKCAHTQHLQHADIKAEILLPPPPHLDGD